MGVTVLSQLTFVGSPKESLVGSISIMHWVVVVAVVVLFFGRGKISSMMSEVALGLKSFKKGIKDDDVVVVDPSKIIVSPANTPIDAVGQTTLDVKPRV